MAFELRNKTIVIISQQPWGEMFVSKHHYAIELAKRGNTVYFLNNPDRLGQFSPGEISITTTEYSNLFKICHRFSFPYTLKFRLRWLFDILVRKHIRKILDQISRPIDLAWSFDISNTLPLVFFPNTAKKIFMAADDSDYPFSSSQLNKLDLILATSEQIMKKYQIARVPKAVLGHGVADFFFTEKIYEEVQERIRVALSYNYTQPNLDRKILLQIIDEHSAVQFHLYGSYSFNGFFYKDEDAEIFITSLKQRENVILHGAVPPTQLAVELAKADCFLICYNNLNHQAKGDNYHKILEFLAIGSVVVANNILAYKDTGLIEMIEERNDNSKLPALFTKVISNLSFHNAPALIEKRRTFATNRTYAKQLSRVELLLNGSAG